MLRQMLRGVLDTLFLAVLAVLTAANTGFLPIDETQTTASAAFGVCSAVACPTQCDISYSTPISQPPYVVWTIETCQVTAPNTQWAGYCDGICGICPLGSRCSGTTIQSGIPCMCVAGAC